MRRISTRPVKAGTALAISLAAFGFGAAPALAATAAVSSTTLIVEGDAADDVLTVSNPAAGTFVVDSAAPITSLSPECAAQGANRVTCTSAAIARLSIRGDAGDDRITNDTGFRSNIHGEAGDDSLTGGSGDDSITGETGLDTADGRAGDDLFFMKGTLVDRVTCGDGLDVATVDDFDIVAADCEQVVGRTGGVTTPGSTPGSGPGGEPVQVFPEPAARACDPSRKREGTSRRDKLTGTPFGDVLIGLGGDDVLTGRGGADCLYGGTGADLLRGGGGADFVKGEDGRDRMIGRSGRDRLAGDRGGDVIAGGGGIDVVAAGAGNDRASGGRGDDSIGGGRGKDRLDGGSGQDRLFGGAGRDSIDAVDGSADAVDCGAGGDAARVDRADQVSNCEAVTRVRR